MRIIALNSKWTRGLMYLLYWVGYLLLFSIIQGVPADDFFTAFRNELISLVPKIIFVALVVEWLMPGLFAKKNILRFFIVYFLLLAAFAVVLRLIDNYIILQYFLTYWKKEPLLSAPPFLYNAIKLQFLATIPVCVTLFNYWASEKKQLQQARLEASHYQNLISEINNSKTALPPENDKDFITVKCDRRMVKIFFADIYYFEAQGNYVFIYTVNKTFKAYLSFSALQEQLPGSMFTRIHRSFIVPLNKVESFTSSYVSVNNTQIPIGRAYSAQAKAGLQQSEGVKHEVG
jgi:hypothetical protein